MSFITFYYSNQKVLVKNNIIKIVSILPIIIAKMDTIDSNAEEGKKLIPFSVSIPCPVLVMKDITITKELLKSNPNKLKIIKKTKISEKNNITDTNIKEVFFLLRSPSLDRISLGCNK